MKIIKIACFVLLLTAFSNKQIKEIDLSNYFLGINGTAVFYNPSAAKYVVYNAPLSNKRSSPCSTFKIMSSYIALSEKIISLNQSTVPWNKTKYFYPQWNQDMNIQEAFKSSCVWYYRHLIDRAGSEPISAYLKKYHYGNQDISDWNGSQNTNTNKPELKGFWIESSLLISPLEQVEFLANLFGGEDKTAQDLKTLMLVKDNPVKIYGKTGMGVRNNRIKDAWFVGFYEKQSQLIFFAVRLDDAENKIKDYRTKASQYAKQIAIDIIENTTPF